MLKFLSFNSPEKCANYVKNYLISLGFRTYIRKSGVSRDSYYIFTNLDGYGKPVVIIRVSDHTTALKNKCNCPANFDVYVIKKRNAFEINEFFIKLSTIYSIPLPMEVQEYKKIVDVLNRRKSR